MDDILNEKRFFQRREDYFDFIEDDIITFEGIVSVYVPITDNMEQEKLDMSYLANACYVLLCRERISIELKEKIEKIINNHFTQIRRFVCDRYSFAEKEFDSQEKILENDFALSVMNSYAQDRIGKMNAKSNIIDYVRKGETVNFN